MHKSLLYCTMLGPSFSSPPVPCAYVRMCFYTFMYSVWISPYAPTLVNTPPHACTDSPDFHVLVVGTLPIVPVQISRSLIGSLLLQTAVLLAGLAMVGKHVVSDLWSTNYLLYEYFSYHLVCTR
jgi:hypothetical protein